MEKVTLNILSRLCGGVIIGTQHIDEEITNVLFDSRRLNSVQGTLFFAFKSANADAVNYINGLYNKGVRMFVSSVRPSIIHNDAAYLITNDVLGCLQKMAEYYRSFFDINICAITGSNGKTITKDWITKLIGSDWKVCSTIKSYNSQIGVPISVLQLEEDDKLGVFEAGISQAGEMQSLERIIRPTIGIFTNIGDAHQINFNSLEEKIAEKLKLFKHCKVLIFHNDTPVLTDMIREFADKYRIKLISWGENINDTYQLSAILSEINLPFDDYASKENAINSYVFCLTIGMDKKRLQQRIRLLEHLESRLEIISGINNSIIINDSYSCDLRSLEIALDYLNRQNKSKKTVILSDLQQTTNNTAELYRQINTLLINKGINNLIAVGNDFFTHRDLITIENKKFYLTTDAFLFDLKRKDFVNKAILVKGATSMGFSKICEALSNKVHKSVLEINLSALEDNVRYYKSIISEKTMVMAMVKASSYGCGGYQVADCLEKSLLADYFTVAFADEGVELRQHGIQKPIMVMNAEDNTELVKQYGLEPVIHSFSVLQKFINENINVHIKLDTGMHRLGFEPKDMTQLVKIIKQHPNLCIKSVFSHLYGADDTALDGYTFEQINLYEQMSGFILRNFDYKILRHLCNSAATVRFKQAHYDMVRLGVGMYGIGVNEKVQQRLRFVHRLKTTITQVRKIQQGEDVSYSRKFVSPKQMTVGVIPVGYADGLNRRFGNQNLSVWVNGSLCPIVGNICMDMCMIDISEANAKEGDSVIVFGNENSVFRLSQILDTIPYEIFTSVSQRIPRVYYQE